MYGTGGGHLERGACRGPRRPLGACRWVYLLTLVLIALLGSVACGSDDGGGQGDQPIELSLEVPPQVRAGETVPLRLVAKNVTDAPVELGLTGREDTGFAGSYDFVVSTADGVEVWSFNAGKVFQAILSVKSLSPGGQLTFVGEWNQADAQGTLVAAGKYVIRGILDIRLDVSTPSERGLTLETDTRRLVIVAE